MIFQDIFRALGERVEIIRLVAPVTPVTPTFNEFLIMSMVGGEHRVIGKELETCFGGVKASLLPIF